MAALAYVFPPLSGLVAYLAGATQRTRFHGLQSVLLGVLWPLGLYIGALVSPGVTQAAAAAGALVWLAFLVGAAVGRDPRWPLLGRALKAMAESRPAEGPSREDAR
ncbi:hypothetical protein BH24ACT26_BH24ACT26_00770 [soil metagenome]